jgi:antitoxin component YwqK of YwqJK toxin-antitoxin module
MTMIKITFVFIFIVFASESVFAKGISLSQLINKNGQYFISDELIPYSGLTLSYFKNGTIKYVGNIKNGMKHGVWLRYLNGSIWKENYLKGKLEGPWEWMRNDGKIWSLGTYKNNKKEGKEKHYYSNGQVYYEGQYSNGKQVGLWKYYDKAGKLVSEIFYGIGQEVK